MLIDAYAQDTVVDTPVKNYAVLNGYPNGALEGIDDSTATLSPVVGTSGTKYYYETYARGGSSSTATNFIRLITDVATHATSGNCGIRPDGTPLDVLDLALILK